MPAQVHSACANEVPNQSGAPTFRDIATRQLSRRQVLVAGSALSAAAAIPGWLPEESSAAPAPAKAALAFTPIAPVDPLVDDVTVPAGFDWKAIIRWGDPLFRNSPAFDPAVPNATHQELQFGYNNDYLDILVTDRRGRQALLCCNHEYVNRSIMFPPLSFPGVRGDQGDHRGAWGSASSNWSATAGAGPGATSGEVARTAGSPRPRRSG